MKLPSLKSFKDLPFNQKVSLLSLAILILVLPFLSASAQTRVELRKMAGGGLPVSPPLISYSCNPFGKALITIQYHNLDYFYIYAVSNYYYYNGAFKIYDSNGQGRFITNPVYSFRGSESYGIWYQYYGWSVYTQRPANDSYKIEFYINHTPQQDGELCGEWATPSYLITPTPTPPPSSACPSYHPCYRTFYGSVKISGDPAPIGTEVKAYSPRGELVGCSSVGSGNAPQTGILPFMRVYGSEEGFFSGMNEGERIIFKVNNNVAFTSPTNPDWHCSHDEINISLELTPTPTPTRRVTPTFTPTPRPTTVPTIGPTNTPTPRPTSAPVVTCPGVCCKGDYSSCNTRLLSPFNTNGTVNDSGGCNPSKVYPGTWCCRSCR